MPGDVKHSKQKKAARRGLALFLMLLVAAAGFLGWRWASALTCTSVELIGVRHANPDEILALARVDTGMTLIEIDPRYVADRVRRHPWVRDARAMRLPDGTVTVDVEERAPVALLVDERGVPSHYLDAEGVAMPVVPNGIYDVPLLRGVPVPPNPLQRVAEPAARALLAALARIDPETDALISEAEIRPGGEVWLYTEPLPERGPIPVRLGHEPFLDKFARLKAFWEDAVLSQPGKQFELIDLRFESQIVTHEAPQES